MNSNYRKDKAEFKKELQERNQITYALKRGLLNNLFESRKDLINHLLDEKFGSFVRKNFPNLDFSLKSKKKAMMAFDKEFHLHISESEEEDILKYIEDNFDEQWNRKTPEKPKWDIQLDLF